MASHIRSLFLLGLFAALILLPVPSLDAAPLGVCELYTGKTTQPTSLIVGEEVEVTLTIDGRCPNMPGTGGADIVLAIDRTSSQLDNGTWDATIQAARTFVGLIDFNSHQIGIVTFAGEVLNPAPVVHQTLSSDGNAVRAALDAIPAPPPINLWTDLTTAIQAAQAELASPRHRPDAQPVLVLLSDGGHNALTSGPPGPAADAAKAAGTLVVTIGLAVDGAAASTLRSLASRPELYFPAPTGDDLEDVLREVAGQITAGGITDLRIVDLLPPEVEYVVGSAQPPPSDVSPGLLTWLVPKLDAGGWTARYRLRALAVGDYSTNKLAYVDYVDADGTPGSKPFPNPVISVSRPGENAILFPVAYRHFCRPARPFDVVLVLDTSSSMWGEKLDRTRIAARQFLDLLEMPPTRASVVAFNERATVVEGLTADRAAALAALDRLPRDEGTRIDRALIAATEVLAGHDPGHAPVLVLLTDGRQAGSPDQDALNAAAGARRAGITVFTIGIGDDADYDLLTLIAGDPDRAYRAATAADLLRIYETIAGQLPCGP